MKQPEMTAYLAGLGSPLADHGPELYASARRHSVDPRLLVAISAAETGLGLAVTGTNDGWNLGPAASWPIAIEVAARRLRKDINGGASTLPKLQQRWAPGPLLQSTWLRSASEVYDQLGGTQNVRAGARLATRQPKGRR